MEPKVKVTEKIRAFLNAYLEEDDNTQEAKEISKIIIDDRDQNFPFRLLRYAICSFKKTGKTEYYLNEVLEGSELHLPEYVPPPRNPELQARIERLKAQQANRQYREMVKNVDKVEHFKSDSIGKEIKALNSQMVSVFNFLVTVGGAFAFGYKATEYTLGSGNPSAFAFQLLNGLILGTVVFFADLYFLVKQTM